jgi:hypothetical protein
VLVGTSKFRATRGPRTDVIVETRPRHVRLAGPAVRTEQLVQISAIIRVRFWGEPDLIVKMRTSRVFASAVDHVIDMTRASSISALNGVYTHKLSDYYRVKSIIGAVSKRRIKTTHKHAVALRAVEGRLPENWTLYLPSSHGCGCRVSEYSILF